ncbi:hypothetical protein [Sphingomonas sp. SRS2]|uniref:hypothetical protein n=1 Tax=Sphingomonas sp. SRS2 TaxID=133190 RepID=UPI00061846B2|nr:hypothetical protein [Sphingomonas sp. SRS2]KKC26804.1 hypothetical protein WP12_07315 [Sphingomonas sp. SRS2]
MLVAAELAEPVDPRVTAMAAALAGRYSAASRSVLFYGSCLREANLDGLMLDFYLIVSDYREAFGKGWLAFANRLIPPNVFPFEHDGLIAKYAVLSEADFTRLASPATRNVSVWARFAQPSRLVWTADESARAHAVSAVTRAAPALLAAARPMLPDTVTLDELWGQAFDLTYAAELRAERKGRATSVVSADPGRYRRFTAPALAAAGLSATIKGDHIAFEEALSLADRRAGAAQWKRRRLEGKALTIARLAKASTTYAGGIDYLAWKINRHAGAAIEIHPWQRRWPILGAISLLPRLILKGSVR